VNEGRHTKRGNKEEPRGIFGKSCKLHWEKKYSENKSQRDGIPKNCDISKHNMVNKMRNQTVEGKSRTGISEGCLDRRGRPKEGKIKRETRN